MGFRVLDELPFHARRWCWLVCHAMIVSTKREWPRNVGVPANIAQLFKVAVVLCAACRAWRGVIPQFELYTRLDSCCLSLCEAFMVSARKKQQETVVLDTLMGSVAQPPPKQGKKCSKQTVVLTVESGVLLSLARVCGVLKNCATRAANPPDDALHGNPQKTFQFRGEDLNFVAHGTLLRFPSTKL
eukprot:3939156-Amphidinium_carterae.2